MKIGIDSQNQKIYPVYEWDELVKDVYQSSANGKFLSDFDENKKEYFINKSLDIHGDTLTVVALNHRDGGESFKELSESYQFNALIEDISFFRDPRFRVVPRHLAEYNLNLTQVVVASITETEEDEVLILKNTSGVLKDKFSMIQGHVDYSDTWFTGTKYNLLQENMSREFHEEIKIDKSIYLNYKMYINSIISLSTNIVDYKHIGVIFKTVISIIDKKTGKPYTLTDAVNLGLISSNEPDKHELHVINKREINHDILKECDSWLLATISDDYKYE